MGLGIVDMPERMIPADPERTMFGRPWRYSVPPMCPKCHYDLRGLSRLQCPECGFVPTFRQLEDAAQQSTADLSAAQDARSEVRVTFCFGVAAVVALLITKLIGIGGLGMVVCVLTGLYMIVIGCRCSLNRRHRTLNEHQSIAGPSGKWLILCGAALMAVSFVV